MLSGLSNILPGGFSGFFGSSYIFINVISSKRYDGTYAKILSKNLFYSYIQGGLPLWLFVSDPGLLFQK